MRIQPYELAEIEFAWCNRVFLRTRTHRRKPSAHLANLLKQTLDDLLQSYGIHVLEIATDAIEVRLLLSCFAGGSDKPKIPSGEPMGFEIPPGATSGSVPGQRLH